MQTTTKKKATEGYRGRNIFCYQNLLSLYERVILK